MLASAQNHIETAGVAAYLGGDDLLRRLCFTSAEVARTFEGHEAYARGRHHDERGNVIKRWGAWHTVAFQILSTQFDAREGQVAGVRLRRLDATRLVIVHEGPVVSPWVYIIATQDFQAVVCRKTGCGTRQTLHNVASHMHEARSPGHGREPQQEEERRIRDPHVAVSRPRGGHIHMDRTLMLAGKSPA
jgi:hypothetical protein